jgi:hypothetical protein
LQEAQSLSNAPTVNFGFKKTKVAIIWRVDASTSFVMFVEQITGLANVNKMIMEKRKKIITKANNNKKEKYIGNKMNNKNQ